MRTKLAKCCVTQTSKLLCRNHPRTRARCRPISLSANKVGGEGRGEVEFDELPLSLALSPRFAAGRGKRYF